MTAYGGGAADFAMKGGLVIPGAQFVVWDSPVGGSQVTALLDAAGGAIGTPFYVTADANGLLKFSVTTGGFNAAVYVIAVGAPGGWGRIRIDPADMASRLATASADAAAATAASGAATTAITNLLASVGAASGLVGYDASGRVDAKNAILLDQASGDPASTPASNVTIFGRTDGGLYVQEPAGDIALISKPSLQKAYTGAGVTVGNTTTETVVQSMTIPAADMRVGSCYEMVLYGLGGTFSTAPTVTPKMRLTNASGTILAQPSAALATSVSTGNQGIKMHAFIECITVGSSGTVRAWVDLILGISSVSPFERVGVLRGTADVTVDTTVSQVYALTWVWSAANAANTVTFNRGYQKKIM
jgi:hypothetical protein